MLIPDWCTGHPLFVFTHKHGTDDPIWTWLMFKTGHVSQSVISSAFPAAALFLFSTGSYILTHSCNCDQDIRHDFMTFDSFVILCVTSGHLWGHLGPCGADPCPAGDRVLPETAVLLCQHHRWHQVSLHKTRQEILSVLIIIIIQALVLSSVGLLSVKLDFIENVLNKTKL